MVVVSTTRVTSVKTRVAAIITPDALPALSDQIKVHCYVCSSSEEDKEDASKQGVYTNTQQQALQCFLWSMIFTARY